MRSSSSFSTDDFVGAHLVSTAMTYHRTWKVSARRAPAGAKAPQLLLR